MIISASRRTDIPRFHVEWFLDSIRGGSVSVVNPFNAHQVRTVSLDPEDIEALVFWTRDPRPLMPYLPELDKRGFRYYFMTTLTGYPREIEPGGIPAVEIVEALSRLHDAIGAARSIWRYDPVFLSSVTDESFHRKNFETLSFALRGKVERVVISAYDEYVRSKGRVAALAEFGIRPRQAHDAEGRLMPATAALLGELALLARAAGMEGRTCAEGEDFSGYGMAPNACIDADLIRRLWGIGVRAGKARNQRPSCRCAASVDIGAYDTCPAGCVYCYATSRSKSGTCENRNRFENT